MFFHLLTLSYSNILLLFILLIPSDIQIFIYIIKDLIDIIPVNFVVILIFYFSTTLIITHYLILF
jgi:hypothetical protein